MFGRFGIAVGGAPEVYGVYDLISAEPGEAVSTLALNRNGTWEATASPSPQERFGELRGRFSVLGDLGPCVRLDLLTPDAPAHPIRTSVCDGVLTATGSREVFLRRPPGSALYPFLYAWGGGVKMLGVASVLLLLLFWRVSPAVRDGSSPSP